MATVYVPGTALASVQGTIGSQPWACIFHWQFGSDQGIWTQADITTLATTMMSGWMAQFGPLMATNVSVARVLTADLTNNTSPSGEAQTGGGPGTRLGNHDPASTAVLVRNIINSRYRGGHPRTYYPLGSTSDIQNENSWSSSLISGIVTAVQGFVTHVQGGTYGHTGGPLLHVVPRYTYTVTNDTVHKKYVRERSGLLAPPFPVQSYLAMTQIGSQRKRLTN